MGRFPCGRGRLVGILASGCRRRVTIVMDTGGVLPARALCQGWPRLGSHPPVRGDTVTLNPAQQCLPMPRSLSTAQGGGSLGWEGSTAHHTTWGPSFLPVCPCPCGPRVSGGIPWAPCPGTGLAGTGLGAASRGSRRGEERLRRFCARRERCSGNWAPAERPTAQTHSWLCL